MPISRFHFKLYALLHEAANYHPLLDPSQFACLKPHLETLQAWWNHTGHLAAQLGNASDRLYFQSASSDSPPTHVRHLISGQDKAIDPATPPPEIPAEIYSSDRVEKVFLWFWRCYPELQARQSQDALLLPCDRLLPDCPRHSYLSTVSAIAGALAPTATIATTTDTATTPYLLLFTFSPVQEFIKASRKFLDFWSGSYLLHYLGARLCWHIAEQQGADAVITPALWGQEIIDALIVEQNPAFANYLPNGAPQDRFQANQASSLSTAGFPNVITALVSSRDQANDLGQSLQKHLKTIWYDFSLKIRQRIKDQVRNTLTPAVIEELVAEFGEPVRAELNKYLQPGCWEWNKLWDTQIQQTWESYFVAVPLGHPSATLDRTGLDPDWIALQDAIAQPRSSPDAKLLTEAELQTYTRFNVGTWWGSLQARLGQLTQAAKNTRNWQIPVAPGERSSLSGQYSAVHPCFHYRDDFRNGRGLPAVSLRLFWQVMAIAFPGLFNGSERLNAIELTKRMAWSYGGVADSLGIELDLDEPYENLIRFPNLSSIAAARFAVEAPQQVKAYWKTLSDRIQNQSTLKKFHPDFYKFTRRPFQIAQADRALQTRTGSDKGYNGNMFSSKWLIDDLAIKEVDSANGEDAAAELRNLVSQAHQTCGFGEASPSDWWCLVLGDGDSMGKYVSGSKLRPYGEYVLDEFAQRTDIPALGNLLATRKRMGPATHVALNRALLDFSNRLVPYLTEQRFAGRVIYSGGDDVMAALPLADLPEYLRSLRAAWSGAADPQEEFISTGGYWQPRTQLRLPLPDRPLFTMGKHATMSLGIVIAHKSVPLPTVLESIWEAEKDRAKKIAGKDGLCFRVIYGSGNTLEALMKGSLLDAWWNLLQAAIDHPTLEFAPVLHKLAEELPRRAVVTAHDRLLSKAATLILSRRDAAPEMEAAIAPALIDWLNAWEDWVLQPNPADAPLGTTPADLGNLLRFSAFWLSRYQLEQSWYSLSNPEQTP